MILFNWKCNFSVFHVCSTTGLYHSRNLFL